MDLSLPARGKLRLFALAAAPALLAFVLALRPVENWDLGFILRIGERVARSGIPVTDPFSFPGEGQPWALEQWLGPLLFWKVFAASGIAGLIVFKALLCAAAVLLAFIAARAASESDVSASFAGLLCAAAGSARFNAQPNVLTTLGVAAAAVLLQRAPLALPALFALWVHVHPGYLSGLVLVCAVSAGAAADVRPFKLRAALRWLSLPLLCAAAGVGSLALFHPLRLQPLWSVLRIFSSPVSRAAITEYAPLGSSYPVTAPVLALLVVPPLGWLLARRRPPLALAAAYLAFAIGELRVGRLVAEASIVLAPAWAHAVAQALASLREKGRIRALDLAWLPPLAALAGAAAHLPVELTWPEALYPRSCYRWIDTHPLPPRGFNDLWFGGSFIFHFDGRRKVFIDGRSFYSDDFFVNEYLPIRNAAPDWQEIARKWGIEWFLLVPGRFAKLHGELRRSGYRIGYRDPYCSVYVR
jgi:hypothetical protein